MKWFITAHWGLKLKLRRNIKYNTLPVSSTHVRTVPFVLEMERYRLAKLGRSFTADDSLLTMLLSLIKIGAVMDVGDKDYIPCQSFYEFITVII